MNKYAVGQQAWGAGYASNSYNTAARPSQPLKYAPRGNPISRAMRDEGMQRDSFWAPAAPATRAQRYRGSMGTHRARRVKKAEALTARKKAVRAARDSQVLQAERDNKVNLRYGAAAPTQPKMTPKPKKKPRVNVGGGGGGLGF